MLEAVLHGSRLEVVGRHDVVRDDVLEHLLVHVEVAGDVVLQLLFECLELCLGVIVVALELHDFLQRVQGALAFGVVGEAALYHALLEFLIVGV